MSDRDPYRVGLKGIGALAFVVALVVAANSFSIGNRAYTAELEHTGGLRVGEEVQVAGVGVGEVTGIELGERRVLVSFTVDDALDLGESTRAEVKVATLLGTHFLLVSPRGTGELDDGLVPMAQTEVPFNLQDVLDTGNREVGQFDVAQVEQAIGQVATSLAATGDEIGPAITGVQRLSELVASRSDELGELLEASRRVAGQLNDSGADIITLLREADVILDTLRARRTTIHALLRDLAVLGDELAGIIEDTRADLAPTLRDLDKVIALLESHGDELDRAVEKLAPTVRYFTNATGSGRWLDLDLPGVLPDNLVCATETCS